MSFSAGTLGPVILGTIGRLAGTLLNHLVRFLQHTSSVWHLLCLTVYYSTVAPLRGRSKLREQLFLMMSKVGVQSFPIVFLVSFLMGAILVLQSGATLEEFGQLQILPGAVAWSLRTPSPSA